VKREESNIAIKPSEIVFFQRQYKNPFTIFYAPIVCP
jgi:hypothetical protein